jgi:hypothetical protein
MDYCPNMIIAFASLTEEQKNQLVGLQNLLLENKSNLQGKRVARNDLKIVFRFYRNHLNRSTKVYKAKLEAALVIQDELGSLTVKDLEVNFHKSDGLLEIVYLKGGISVMVNFDNNQIWYLLNNVFVNINYGFSKEEICFIRPHVELFKGELPHLLNPRSYKHCNYVPLCIDSCLTRVINFCKVPYSTNPRIVAPTSEVNVLSHCKCKCTCTCMCYCKLYLSASSCIHVNCQIKRTFL